ncbi:lytic transglycosylase domain-containing protein [Wenjunlia tyrosinilytica]|uniref:Transglycosylase SLT domain-containing protein n=1 Tax=Wenjunlia tyrosinilytica TaxID=1544741 RepID=A0A917ZEH1_9ACTN|nr:lytic transglycosylase domain-containing protein [Wenjunlia tyrosinilytica]GGO81531.1 hypothetical protein GCM10012280_05980 [Wenjunlia tyrosinilytica]
MGTAVAAVTMAALTASQAPGLASASSHPGPTAPPGPPISGDSPYYTGLPPLVTPDKPGTSIPLPSAGTDTAIPGGAGIPATVLAAYKKAQASLARTNPECNLPWELLAAIGQVESNQARGGNVDADGTTISPIRGPQLNGVGFANISDTDGGAYDGDALHDRAVGPMQFIPSTWATWGTDGNGDGKSDPNNVFDAALAAGHYLCAGGRDLSNPDHMAGAILGYNHSYDYLHTVRTWYEYFRTGHHTVPDNPGHPSPEPSYSSTPSPSATPSSPAPSHTGGPKPKPTPTVSASATVKPKPSPSSSTSSSPSPKPSDACPADPSPSPSDSESGKPTRTPLPTPTTPKPKPSSSTSGSPKPTPSPSDSDDPCATPTPTPSPSGSKSPSPQATPGVTPAPKP